MLITTHWWRLLQSRLPAMFQELDWLTVDWQEVTFVSTWRNVTSQIDQAYRILNPKPRLKVWVGLGMRLGTVYFLTWRYGSSVTLPLSLFTLWALSHGPFLIVFRLQNSFGNKKSLNITSSHCTFVSHGGNTNVYTCTALEHNPLVAKCLARK